MARGFVYLVAIMDWHSRKVLSWKLSNSMDTSFCIEALEEALDRYGKPEIFNTDQGLENPDNFGHRFRKVSDSDSGFLRTVIPVFFGHFQSIDRNNI